MAQPLKLPPWVKSAARLVRDTQMTNAIITSSLRPVVRLAPAMLGAEIIKRAPRLGLAKARLPNGRWLRMHSAEQEAIHTSVFYNGWRGDEPEVLPIWFSLASKSRTIIDVGAHIGHMTVVAGLANSAARIVAFEPLPRVAAILNANVRLNRLDNVVVYQMALGSETRVASFYAVPKMIPSSSSLSKDFMVSGDHLDLEELKVQVARLDAILPEAEAPVLLKIDTETTEPDVLAGAGELISRTHPIIIVEVLAEHDTGPALDAELDRLGYRYTGYLMTGSGLERRDSIRGDPHWRNYLLVPLEGSTIQLLGGISWATTFPAEAVRLLRG